MGERVNESDLDILNERLSLLETQMKIIELEIAKASSDLLHSAEFSV